MYMEYMLRREVPAYPVICVVCASLTHTILFLSPGCLGCFRRSSTSATWRWAAWRSAYSAVSKSWVYMLEMKEGRKKEGRRKVKQTTSQSNTTHPRQSLFQIKMGWLPWWDSALLFVWSCLLLSSFLLSSLIKTCTINSNAVTIIIRDCTCMFIIPWVFALWPPGTVGYVGTSFFVKKIYATVKIDWTLAETDDRK